jgi:transposase
LYVVRTGCSWRQLPADFPPWQTVYQKGFSVLPRRWAVERTLAWITAHRRLARDYERDPAHSQAMIRWAAINTMTRRLARGRPATRTGLRPLEYE